MLPGVIMVTIGDNFHMKFRQKGQKCIQEFCGKIGGKVLIWKTDIELGEKYQGESQNKILWAWEIKQLAAIMSDSKC